MLLVIPCQKATYLTVRLWKDMVRFMTGILPDTSCHSFFRDYLFTCKNMVGCGKILGRNLTRKPLIIPYQKAIYWLVRIWRDMASFVTGIMQYQIFPRRLGFLRLSMHNPYKILTIFWCGSWHVFFLDPLEIWCQKMMRGGQIFLRMLDIVDILFCPRITEDDAAYRASLISDHHEEFCYLYPSWSVIPKMHFMVHMPRLMIQLVDICFV